MGSKFQIKELTPIDDGIYEAPIDLMTKVIDKVDKTIDEGKDEVSELEKKIGEIEASGYDEEFKRQKINEYQNRISTLENNIHKNPHDWRIFSADINKLQRDITNDYLSEDLYSIKKGKENLEKQFNAVENSQVTEAPDKALEKAYYEEMYKRKGGAKGRAYKDFDVLQTPLDSKMMDFDNNLLDIKRAYSPEKSTTPGFYEGKKWRIQTSTSIEHWDKKTLTDIGSRKFEDEMKPEFERKAERLAVVQQGLEKGSEEYNEFVNSFVSSKKNQFLKHIEDNIVRTNVNKTQSVSESTEEKLRIDAIKRERAARAALEKNAPISDGQMVTSFKGSKKPDVSKQSVNPFTGSANGGKGTSNYVNLVDRNPITQEEKDYNDNYAFYSSLRDINDFTGKISENDLFKTLQKTTKDEQIELYESQYGSIDNKTLKQFDLLWATQFAYIADHGKKGEFISKLEAGNTTFFVGDKFNAKAIELSTNRGGTLPEANENLSEYSREEGIVNPSMPLSINIKKVYKVDEQGQLEELDPKNLISTDEALGIDVDDPGYNKYKAYRDNGYHVEATAKPNYVTETLAKNHILKGNVLRTETLQKKSPTLVGSIPIAKLPKEYRDKTSFSNSNDIDRIISNSTVDELNIKTTNDRK